jgi:hypothetical protein
MDIVIYKLILFYILEIIPWNSVITVLWKHYFQNMKRSVGSSPNQSIMEMVKINNFETQSFEQIFSINGADSKNY